MPKNPQQAATPLIDNFEFILVGAGSKFPFRSYVSAVDPTSAEPGILIMGSQNVYKTLNNTIGVRPGLLKRGAADATLAGTKSSYEWQTSTGHTRVLRVNNGLLEVEFDIGDGNGLLYRNLLATTKTRFVFDPWWDDGNKKDRLLMARGNYDLLEWSGGIGTLASTTSSTIVLSGTQTALEQGFDASGTVVIAGTTYSYSSAGFTSSVIAAYTSTNNKINIAGSGVGSVRQSQLFTTGAGAKQLLSATARFNMAGTAFANIYVTAGLYTDNAGVPGTLLTGATAPAIIFEGSGAGDFDLAFTFGNGVSVAGATNYHLVLSVAPYSGNIVAAYTGNSSGVGTSISTDGGITWSAQNGHLYCSLTENDTTGQTLVGVSPSPAAVPVGTLVAQEVHVNSNLPDPSLAADFLKVIGNQVHVGAYTSRLVYVSASNFYLNYVVPTVRAPGDPDLLTLDSLVRGITAQKDKNGQNTIAVISGGLGDWYTVGRAPLNVGTGSNVTPTEQVSVTKSQVADLATALAHEFIDSVGDNIIFLDQNNQLREFGTVRNITNPVYPLLSLDVYDELRSVNFTGGALRAVADQGGETVYITSPLSGVDYVYQIRQSLDIAGNLHAERLWQPPQVRGLSRIALIDGITYGHSAANPMMYRLWDTQQYHDDSPSGEALPYECHAFFAYLNIGKGSLLYFDKVYAEGYMTTGTVLGCNVYQEYQAAKNEPTFIINSPVKGQKKAKFYTGLEDISLGQNSLGDNPLGDGLQQPGGAQALLPKFRVMRNVTALDIFEYAFDVFSNTADAQWELLCIGANHMPSERKPVAIRN